MVKEVYLHQVAAYVLLKVYGETDCDLVSLDAIVDFGEKIVKSANKVCERYGFEENYVLVKPVFSQLMENTRDFSTAISEKGKVFFMLDISDDGVYMARRAISNLDEQVLSALCSYENTNYLLSRYTGTSCVGGITKFDTGEEK